MLRLIPTDRFHELRPRARRYDLEAVLPQHNSLPGVLTIAARPRHGERGWWSVWIVAPFDGRPCWRRWWNPQPSLPRVGYRLSAERDIVWRNSLCQRYRLAVREALLPAKTWRADVLPGIEILAFAKTDADMTRVWFHDRSRLDGFDGVAPFLRAGRQSRRLTPARTPERVRAAKQLHDTYNYTQQMLAAGKRYVIFPEGPEWT